MKQKNLVLMVVAVGCGLAAAFLTSRMSAKTPVVETVDLLVAAQDLPVGTVLTKDKLPKMVTKKAVSRDAVPAKAVESQDELSDKRLSRPLRAGEAFTPADLLEGAAIKIPPGKRMATLPVTAVQAAAGFVGPGSRVDVLASVKLKSQVRAFPILVDMLILAVNAEVAPSKDGAFQTVSMVSFAVDQKQALLIKLAQARSCDLSLLLRNPDDADTENDREYEIDAVIKLLQDEEKKAVLREGEDRTDEPPAPAPAPAPKVETVSVPVAVADIPAGTLLTADLFADPKAFGAKELPKELAADAVADFAPFLGQTFKTGLGKGQWATAGLIGPADPKPGVKDAFTPPKEAAPKDPPPVKEPSAKPPVAKAPPPPVKVGPARRTHEVAVHTASGTRVYRYEEVSPGQWRSLGEVAPKAAPAPADAPADKPAPSDAPPADARRVD